MDPHLIIPFLAGLPLALTLPLLGNLLRLREEWLATLGLAHLAGATALAGLGLGVPALLGAPAGAVLGAGLKALSRLRDNDAYAVMILAGWALMLLIAANSTLGHALAQAMVDGQLYFASWREASVAVLLALLTLPALARLAPALMRARLLPSHERANRLPAWRWHFGFDLLVALNVAAATASLGLLAGFALVFAPARLAFLYAGSWRTAARLSAGVGLAAYVLAYALALGLDQPFGPVLVALLVVALVLGGALARLAPPWRGRALAIDRRAE
ncbi:MAG: metal ABC transporter permease [Thiobacillaceae bacterium]|nr:metal ABC transporter permease [Thiobacillaceae bacterium]MCX7674178.1 metal ABC transporter permease [Thiobacillaceae bacterium]MDW8322884.1 metal ABC transporter permease [Burkholderiales bacterium]